MLSGPDRDQFAIKRIVDFYESQPTDCTAYFEAAWRYKHRAALGKPTATLANIATASRVSPKYLPMIWGILGEDQLQASLARPALGPVAKLRAMWKSLPAPAAGKVDESAVRGKCTEMRDFVLKVRHHTAMQFTAPVVSGPPERLHLLRPRPRLHRPKVAMQADGVDVAAEAVSDLADCPRHRSRC